MSTAPDRSELVELNTTLTEITAAWDGNDSVDTDLGTDVQNLGERLCALLDALTLDPEVNDTLRDEASATHLSLANAIDHYRTLDEHDTAASADIYELLAPALSLADRALPDGHTGDGPRFWAADADAEQHATHVFGEHTAQIVDERAGGAVAYAHDNNAAWIVAALNATAGAFPSWPEVAEPYADGTDPIERYVVTLVVGFDPTTAGGNVTDPKQAALAALDLTRDDHSRSTVWHVYDRDTGRLHRFDQSEFDTDHIDAHEE